MFYACVQRFDGMDEKNLDGKLIRALVRKSCPKQTLARSKCRKGMDASGRVQGMLVGAEMCHVRCDSTNTLEFSDFMKGKCAFIVEKSFLSRYILPLSQVIRQ
jgi:hypothetical protein